MPLFAFLLFKNMYKQRNTDILMTKYIIFFSDKKQANKNATIQIIFNICQIWVILEYREHVQSDHVA